MFMKKILVAILCIFLLAGCTRVDNLSYDDLIKEVMYQDNKHTNERHIGYSFYRPQGFVSLKRDDYNHIFTYKGNKIYMHVDLYSYNKKVKVKHKLDKDLYYAKELNDYNKKGFVEIKEEKDAYFYRILYNYIRVEGYAGKKDMKRVFTKISQMLSSFQFNDKVIAKIVSENARDFEERELEYFKNERSLKFGEETDSSYADIKKRDEYLY